MDTGEAAARDLISALNENTTSLESCKNLEFTLEGIPVNTKLLKNEFKDLHIKSELIDILYAMHIEKASIIQSMSIPLIFAKNNLIAQSVAGTGKTLAFALGTLNMLNEYSKTKILVITPTKELNMQISSLFNKILKDLNGFCLNLTSTSTKEASKHSPTFQNVNSADLENQNCLTAEEPCVVVGTPTSVLKAIAHKKINYESLSHIVIDEADACLGNFMAASKRLFEIIGMVPQYIFFSASYPEDIQKLIRYYLKKSHLQTKELLEDHKMQEEILLFNIQSTNQKIETLKSLLEFLNVSQLIIFCNTKKTVDFLAEKLIENHHSVSKIHGGIELVDRENALLSFKKVETKILVTTDVFSRGMDVPLVNLVINYDLPVHYENKEPNFETYQHRIGRTARFGRKGFVIDFVNNEEDFCTLTRLIDNLNSATRMIDIQSLEKAFIDSLDID